MTRLWRWMLRATTVVLFAGWACSQGGGTGCSSCSSGGFSYPSQTPGKEPITNAAELRINQGALDWVQAHLGDVFSSMCCPSDPKAALSPAEQCWGKAMCFTDTENAVQMLHFYLGSPGAPMSLPDGIHLRNGDDYPDEAVDDGDPNDDDNTTGNLASRPYCNDVGGRVCERENQDLSSFCRPSSSAGCNNPNPTDPSQRDYCCGDNAHGINANPFSSHFGDYTDQLDICTGNRPMPRCHGYPSNVSLRLDQLKNIALTLLPATATQPAGIGVSVSGLNIGVDTDIEVDDVASASVTCFAKDSDPTQGTVQNASISMDLRPIFARLSPDQPETLVLGSDQITVSNFNLGSLNAPNITTDSLDPECQDENWQPDGLFQVDADEECVIGCGIAGAAGGILSDLFDTGLGSLLSGPISSALAGAIAGGLNGTPVEVDAQLDLRAMLSQTLPLTYGKPIGVLAAANGGGLATFGSGTTLGLNAGIDVGTETDTEVCVPSLPPPAAAATGDANLPTTISVVDNSQTPPVQRTDTYHVAAAIALPALQRAFYDVFNSGLLCIGVDSAAIAHLTSGSQIITAGVLFLLAPELQQIADEAAPLYVQLEPRTYPTVALGTGQVGADGKTIDSMLQIGLNDLQLSFYIFSQDRFIRVFSVSADLALGLSILRGANNALELSVDGVTSSNVQTTFNALSATDYSQVVSVVLNLVTGTLLSNKLTFSLNFDSALQAVLGPDVYVRINDVQRAGDSNDYLAVYLTACAKNDPDAPPVCADGGSPADDLVAPTLSTALPLYVQPEKPLPAVLRTSLVPAGALAVHVQDDGFARQYAVRVDTGLYNSLVRADANGDIVVKSPALLTFGEHRLEIRSQVGGHYETLASAPKILDVELDAERPLATITPLDAFGGLRLSASDLVSKPENIAIEWRGVGAAGISTWHSGVQGEVLTPEMLHDVYNLELRATDHAGNISEVVTYAWQSPPAHSASRFGCHAAGQSSLLALIAVALFFVRRRRA